MTQKMWQISSIKATDRNCWWDDKILPKIKSSYKLFVLIILSINYLTYNEVIIVYCNQFWGNIIRYQKIVFFVDVHTAGTNFYLRIIVIFAYFHSYTTFGTPSMCLKLTSFQVWNSCKVYRCRICLKWLPSRHWIWKPCRRCKLVGIIFPSGIPMPSRISEVFEHWIWPE